MIELEKLCSELEPELKKLDEKRRKVALTLIPVCLITGIIILVALVSGRSGLWVAVGIGVVALVILGLVYNSKINELRNSYKELVIRRLLGLFGPGFSYYPKHGISQSEFDASKLFSTKPNRYHTEDLVEGRLDKTELKFAEIDAKHVSGSGKNRSEKKVFNGVFFMADFHKHFNSKTWVVPDIAERTFGSWLGNSLQKLNFSRPGGLIKLENPEFERIFAVFGHDEVEARYILSPAMMERMVSLKRRFNTDISFAFTGTRVIVALAISENLFEPPGAALFSDYCDFTRIRKHFDWLRQLLGIVEELNLNTRIWTKE